MKRVLVIGIGAGDPEYMTVQAINALNEVDIFFLIEKETEKDDLAKLRTEICERYIRETSYRTVAIRDPARDRTPSAYLSEVSSWRDKRATLYQALIERELQDGECGAFLIWGDPSLYDGTMEMLDQILVRAPGAFEYRVIPGISSVQALAAGHKVPLNRLGGAFQVTTGRRLEEKFPEDVDDVVVMLDARNAFRSAADDDVEIYWGAYLGTENEVLISGKVREVMDEIERVRAQKKAEKGWIMDTYLLRRTAKKS